MIVGTAGHIDHGKSTLVRALTGIDPDRLPEEKRRGITIELGYAWWDREDGERIGFVDVPGHERLVHTMLAGATGLDAALLLVAADDGIMPQTREHLAVLSLLGITQAIAVITKADRVDAARLAEVSQSVRVLLAPTALADAPIVAVSALQQHGLDTLRGELTALTARVAARSDTGLFRLAVDRSFSLSGTGTVVTGTIHSGRVRIGDELQLSPDARGELLRVRSLHAQNRACTEAHAGQRCALGLVGVAREDIARGAWLSAPAAALRTERLDVRLTLWHEEARALRSGTPVHVHLGASDVLGSVALLEGEQLAPGQSMRAQLVLREALGAWRGDRLVLRDNSASRTLAGGVVLDPFAPARYRRTDARHRVLAAFERETAGARLAALLEASPEGVDLQGFGRTEGLADPGTLAAPEEAIAGPGGRWLMSAAHWEHLAARILASLAAFHAAHPDESGPDLARLRRLVAPRIDESLWRHRLQRLHADGRVGQTGAQWHLPEHAVRLSALEERFAQRALPLLLEGGFDPPWARDLARLTGESEPQVRTVLARLARRGELHPVVRDLYYPHATVRTLAKLARDLAGPDGRVRAAEFRDATGLGRKRAIQILEFLDRVGVLRRVRDDHLVRTDSTLYREDVGPTG